MMYLFLRVMVLELEKVNALVALDIVEIYVTSALAVITRKLKMKHLLNALVINKPII